jgi:acyl carrier protein
MGADVIGEIRTFIVEEVLWDSGGGTLDDDAPLLSGVLDSFGLRSLVSFIDERFGIEVTNDDLVPEHFNSVRTIAAFVEARAASA